MVEGKRVLALIPARGGSKRLPGKNLRLLHGKPMIAWSIEAALGAQSVDAVVVSTDDDEIAKVARHHGAQVPFMRPAELATDTAGSAEVALHALGACAAAGEEFDILILLQPTSPLRRAEHIDAALALMAHKKAAAVVSVCETEHPPQWCNTLGENGSMSGFMKKAEGKRSQEFPAYYRLNGALYAIEAKTFAREKRFFLDADIYAYVMERHDSADVDTELDFLIADTVMRSREEGGLA